MTRVERLTNYSNIKPENIRFCAPIVSKVPGKDVTYQRIPITINHDDGTYGPLLIKTEKCLTFGARQNFDKETGELTGWSLPIAMYDRLEPTEAQREWVEEFYKVVECCEEFLMNNHEFEKVMFDNIGNCMWWSDDRTRGPTLYPKIISGKSSKRLNTKFRMVKDLLNNSGEGVSITKEELTENYNVIAVINFDSIYVCDKDAYLQVKVYEALLEEQEELPSLLRPTLFKD